MGTPHNHAKEGQIAKTVLMPGDPLRAKYIAETFLENPVQFNTVRNMFGYTGTYKGKEVSVMGSGMGMPSIGIYSYELYKFYGVETIIRIGSTGAIQPHVHIRDVIITQAASTDSNWSYQYGVNGTLSACATYDLIEKAVKVAKDMGVNYHVGPICSMDIFYNADEEAWKKWSAMGHLGVEMESYALFCNAAYLGKKAACLLTVSDSFFGEPETTAEERQNSFTQMMEIALEIAE
ncbi:MAG: purine-nucleoside phosphorylase [Erysipelotrichales bacterium]|nr:purine-nucleoside phosphorylase [Erysipelotrichales bacterium]